MSEKHELIAFDLDGTAIASHPDALPTNRLIEAVQALDEQGYAMAVATSRPLAYAKPVVEALGIASLHVVAGGAFLYDAKTNTSLEPELLTDTTGKVAKLLKQFNAYPCYVGNTTFREDEQTTVSSIDFQEGVSGLYYLNLDEETAKSIVYGLRAIHDVDDVAVWSVYIDTMLPKLDGIDVHILSSNATKGSGVTKLQKWYGLDVAQTTAIGDGFNDKSMMDVAGKKVVMGNAEEKLVASLGTHAVQIGNIEEDGLASYFESLLK